MKKINKFLASFLVAVMILTAAPLTVFAETLSGTCGEGVAWSLDTEKGELIISGNGKMDDFYANSYSSPICNVPWYSVRDKVQSVLIKDGVTHIGTLAFYNCANLTEITFPDSVTSFGGSVFSGCYKLTSVDLPENLTEIGESVFSMSNITKITIPDSVTAIGDSAFSRCYDLAEITFGANVKSIGENAFSETGELENIYFTGTLGDWCEISFGNVNSNPWRYGEKLYVDGKLVSGDIIIPEGTEAINDYSIFSEGGITGITIPASVKRIGDGTLYSLSDLEKITVDELNTAYSSDESGALFDKSKAELMLFPAKSKCTEYTVPDGIVSIRASAFDACSGLVNVTLPESLTEIGNSAFLNCSALESIIIPGNVTSVGDYAFYYCKKLTDITIPASVNHFGQSAFSGTSSKKTVRYEGDIAGWCAINFDNYSAPIQYSGEILYIDGKCIEGELVIPEGVEKINDYAFRFCSAITSLTLPDSITEIGVRAFSNCSSLKNISFGKNIKTIGAAAFEDCRALTTLNIPDGISKIGGQSFSNCTALKDVTIGNGLTEVEGHLFYMCKNLQSVTLPETVTIIEQAAFCECNNLNSINLSENLKTIENTAFGDCFSLTEIKIPDSVTYLGEYAFYGCESLVEATIGDGITTIKSYTFENCQNLETLVLSDNVLRIDKYAFNNCTKLADIYYSGSQAEWDEIYIYGYNEPLNTAEIHFNHIVFDSKEGTCGDSLVWKLDGITGDLVISGTGKMTNYSSTSPAPWSDYCNQIYSITVKDGVTTIGDDTFNGCVNLKNVSLPASLTKIGNSAFRDCASLKEITIPDNVTSLGYYAFYGCTGFEAITVGNGVKTIGNHAFRMCSNLKTITLPVSLTSVSKNAFNECPSLSTVNYLGTSAQWAAVTIADSNDPLVNAKLICLGDTHKCTYGEWTVTVEPTATADGEKIHTCTECGEAETVTIPALGFETSDCVTIDFATNTISGFNAGETSLESYTTTVNDGYTWEYETDNSRLGTGDKVILKDGDSIIGEYTILIYGDATGDSWYDGQDAIIVDCLANGMLTQDDVSEAVYMAADCNHDGVIDALDVALLNEAGTLLANVDQSKSSEELLETSSAYVEYLDLIDQSFEIDVENEEDSTISDTEENVDETEPSQDNFFSFILDFVEFFKQIFNFILDFINK